MIMMSFGALRGPLVKSSPIQGIADVCIDLGKRGFKSFRGMQSISGDRHCREITVHALIGVSKQ
jgi:hypothetical protein